MNGARFASGRELELRVVLREKGYNLSRSKKPFPPALLPFQHRILYRAALAAGQNIIDGVYTQQGGGEDECESEKG